MKKKIKYIHYGHKKFDIKKFDKIKNRSLGVKPLGGFWGSRIDSDIGWLQWCIGNEFCMEKLKTSFTFILKKNAKVLTIDNYNQLKGLPLNIDSHLNITLSWITLDFEKLAEEYDAIEVLLSKDRNKLYFGLYGWDCDSIIVMNPKIVEIEK